MKFLYDRWVEVLSFLDLLGTDSRPSSTKMMSFGISMSVLFTAWKRTFSDFDGEVWTWQMFWTLLLCCSVMFGRWGFDRFMDVLKKRGLTTGP